MELYELTAQEARQMLVEKKVSSRELTEAALGRISAVDERVKAFLVVTDELALRQADAVDAKIASGGELSPVEGVPVGIKDVLCTRGVETTCASKILKGFVPPYSATVVDKLEQAGACFWAS